LKAPGEAASNLSMKKVWLGPSPAIARRLSKIEEDSTVSRIEIY